MTKISKSCGSFLFLLVASYTAYASSQDDLFESAPARQVQMGHGQLVNSLDSDEISAFQGLEKFELNNNDFIAVTHGYTSINASIIDHAGVLKKSTLLDQSIPSELIADVTVSPDALWWTGYRSKKIYRTDLALRSVEIIDLPESVATLVGLTSVPELQAVIFVHREKPSLGVLKTDLSEPVKFYPLKKPLDDPYDIKYYEGLIYLVDRAAGKILTVDIRDLASGQLISPKVFAENLSTPQHLDFFGDYLFVIETNANQVSRFSLIEEKRHIFSLNDNRIYRGLVALKENLVALTGFIDQENTRESRTHVAFYELNDSVEAKKEHNPLQSRLENLTKSMSVVGAHYPKLEGFFCDQSKGHLTDAQLGLEIDSSTKSIAYSKIKEALSLPTDTQVKGIYLDSSKLTQDIHLVRNLIISNFSDKAEITLDVPVPPSKALDFVVSILPAKAQECLVRLRLHFAEKAKRLHESGYDIVSVIGRAGLDLGTFSLPYGTQYYRGDLWTTDCSNENISAFSLDGQFLGSFGEYGTRLGTLDTPAAMQIIDNRLYVVEERNHRVQVFNLSGQAIDVFGAYKRVDDPFLHLDKLNNPLGIAHNGNHLAIVDYGNDRVVGVNTEQGYKAEWVSANVAGDEVFKWQRPYYIRWSKKGNYFVVSNRGANEVVLIGPEGQKIRTLGDTLLDYPHEIDTDADGNIYVADMNNHRVVIYSSQDDFDENTVRLLNFPESYGVPKTLTVLHDGLLSIGFIGNGSAYFLVVAPDSVKDPILISEKSSFNVYPSGNEFFRPHGTSANALKPSTNKVSVSEISTVREVYSRHCSSCHESGAYGAPARGNIEAWEAFPRDLSLLLERTIEGRGAMIARGGCDSCSDELLMETITFMLPMTWTTNTGTN